MEAHSQWYNRTAGAIDSFRDKLNRRDNKKYRLDLLRRVAGRADDFSSYCGECQAFKGEITGIVGEMGNLVQLSGDKERRRRYNKSVGAMVKHLQKTHRLVSAGNLDGGWHGNRGGYERCI